MRRLAWDSAATQQEVQIYECKCSYGRPVDPNQMRKSDSDEQDGKKKNQKENRQTKGKRSKLSVKKYM